jgi:hypothetical protein
VSALDGFSTDQSQGFLTNRLGRFIPRRWTDVEQAGRIVFVLGVIALTVSACLARWPGLDPDSLWADDLVWGAIVRAQDLGTMLSVPAHAPPGFFALLWGGYTVFGDPEWSLQLLPFASAILAIPVMAVAVRALTQSDGLGLLAAGLTALNPLLAHYTVFVKQYSFDFLITALLLLAGAWVLGGRDLSSRALARLAIASGACAFFSVTSVFTSFPAVHLGAVRALFERHRGRAAILAATAAYDLLVLSAYFAMRDRAGALVRRDFRREFMPLDSLDAVGAFLDTKGRRVIEAGLPSWKETVIWNPETVSWTLPIVGLGLVWLLARRQTRAMGWVVLGFAAAFLTASALHVYPLGRDRTDVFAFPVVIALAAVGVHMMTAWVPRRETLRLALGVAVAGFALYQPVNAEYWAVNDVWLVKHVATAAAPEDGLILSPSGSFLAAYYGPWPVTISATTRRANSTQAEIARDLTVHLPPVGAPRPFVEKLVTASRPERIWYLAFRTGATTADREVLETLESRGYLVKLVERTSRGRLYVAIDSHG